MTRVASLQPRTERRITRVAGPRGTALILRGAIGGKSEDELREALQAAIDEGAVAVVLDLSEVDAISSSARELVASASSTLADRGGVLLAWTMTDGPGEASYVMRELRDASDAALVRDRPVHGRSEARR